MAVLTPAKVYESEVADELISGDERGPSAGSSSIWATEVSGLTFTWNGITWKPRFWLNPVMIADGGNFRSVEINRIARIIEERRDQFMGAWDDRFGS